MPKVNLSVRTFNERALNEAAIALNNQIFPNFLPEIIIGIRTGGFTVAELMTKAAMHKPLLLAISRQRASTQAKNKVKGLKSFLRFLPYFITNFLRIAEHKRLCARLADENQSFSPNIDELAALRGVLRTRENCKILIVDDAIDSGATMKAVYDVVRAEANSACNIKTAAITVTTDFPLIQPNYTLFSHVLCRFPWSFDFKG